MTLVEAISLDLLAQSYCMTAPCIMYESEIGRTNLANNTGADGATVFVAKIFQIKIN